MNLPSSSVQRRLQDRLLHLPGLLPSAKPVLIQLFQQTIDAVEANREPEGLHVIDILNLCRNAGGPRSEQSTRNALTNLREVLKTYFAHDEDGKRCPFVLEIDKSSPALIFSRRKKSGEGIRKYWAIYFTTFYPSGLYYPAPQFFRHRNGSYLRYPRANWREQQALVAGVMNLSQHDLRPTYSFIASGMTTAVIRLTGCFYRDDSLLRAVAVKPTDDDIPWEYETIVVLGSPTANMGLIAKIENGMPFRTSRDKNNKTSFCRAGMEPYTDGNEEECDFDQDRITVTKYVLLTRRVEERLDPDAELYHQSRIVTLLSGHSRSVEAVTNLLTSERKIGTLIRKLPESMPPQFQVIFEIGFETDSGELIAKGVKILKVVLVKCNKPLTF